MSKRSARAHAHAASAPLSRKISETILDFGEPLLAEFSFESPIDIVYAGHQFVIAVWNAHVMASPRWGQPGLLAQMRDIANAAPENQPMREALAVLSARRTEPRFANVSYTVGEWHIKIKHDRSLSFFCDAREPPSSR
jgi:hypothetical protein